MESFYLNVNTLKDKIEAIDKELLELRQRIKQLDSWDGLPINQVLLGDCLELMKTLPDNSVDCVVTDPPYSLGKVKSIIALLQAWLSGECGTEHHSNGFMGSTWDVLPSPNVWREVLRVLKPGGYALVFAGTRTVDLMGLSLRLAGFELQDAIAHFQGQGFPKAKTQLKPGFEPIIMAYKPGKRSLNIEECRIDKKRYPSNVILSHSSGCISCGTKQVKTLSGSNVLKENRKGDLYKSGFKPMTLLAHHNSDGTETIAAYECSEKCPIRLLDEQTAQMRASKSRGGETVQKTAVKPNNLTLHGLKRDFYVSGEQYQDGDGIANASRFFLNLPPEIPFIYQPKASKSDRTVNGAVENNHITVKPTNLMAYLVRLVCPVDGIVLDPFIGSGSTALGCLKEQRHYIGIEQSSEYHQLAIGRIKAYAETLQAKT